MRAPVSTGDTPLMLSSGGYLDIPRAKAFGNRARHFPLAVQRANAQQVQAEAPDR